MQDALIAGAIALSALAGADAAAQTAKPCQAAEHRQFDFWIGQWDVYLPDGKKAGENLIVPFANGCGLLESWSGSSGTTGKSLNMYDVADRRWHQVWVDSDGTRLMLDGGLVDGKMVLGSDAPDPGKPGIVVKQKISWTPNPDGSVRQLWQVSTDGGATWRTEFDGKYVKR